MCLSTPGLSKDIQHHAWHLYSHQELVKLLQSLLSSSTQRSCLHFDRHSITCLFLGWKARACQAAAYVCSQTKISIETVWDQAWSDTSSTLILNLTGTCTVTMKTLRSLSSFWVNSELFPVTWYERCMLVQKCNITCTFGMDDDKLLSILSMYTAVRGVFPILPPPPCMELLHWNNVVYSWLLKQHLLQL